MREEEGRKRDGRGTESEEMGKRMGWRKRRRSEKVRGTIVGKEREGRKEEVGRE